MNLFNTKMPRTLKDHCILDNTEIPKDRRYWSFHNSSKYFYENLENLSCVPNEVTQDFILRGINSRRDSEVSETSEYNRVYKDVIQKVMQALVTRGISKKILYSTCGFTSQKTGNLSKQRVLLGYRDCWFKDSSLNDKKLFHDIYLNLSYPNTVSKETINKNAYALYALTQALSNLVPIRVIVVNAVLHKNYLYPEKSFMSTYGYILKQFGSKIKPKEFIYGITDAKRTYGFGYYSALNAGYHCSAQVQKPQGTVSIHEFNLDETIDEILSEYLKRTGVQNA